MRPTPVSVGDRPAKAPQKPQNHMRDRGYPVGAPEHEIPMAFLGKAPGNNLKKKCFLQMLRNFVKINKMFGKSLGIIRESVHLGCFFGGSEGFVSVDPHMF